MKKRWEAANERALHRVAERLALDLVRLGIGAGEFTSILKAAYVRVASELARSDSGKINRARVAIITGLTRAEVGQQLSRRSNKDVPGHAWHRNRATRVLDGWYTDAKFKTDSGRPRDLQRKGSPVSFESLVRKYSGDIPTRAMLNELLDADAVEIRSNGLLRAKRRRLAASRRLPPRAPS